MSTLDATLKVELKHGNWSPAEDAIIISIMSQPDPPSWLEIAEAHFPETRNGNQLRHRWADVLKHGGRRKSGTAPRRKSGGVDGDAATKQRAKRRPGRPKQNFTFEEDEFILQLHDEVGLSFESIERDYFPERSTGSIKARYTKISYRSSPPASPPRGIASRPTRKSLPAPRQTPKKQNKSFPPPERTNDLFYDGPLGPAPSSDCAEAGRTLVLMRSKSFENENRFPPPAQAKSKPHPRAPLSPIKPRSLASPSTSRSPHATPPCPLHFLASHASFLPPPSNPTTIADLLSQPNTIYSSRHISYSLTPFVPLPRLSFSQAPDAPFEGIRKRLVKELRLGEGELVLVDEKGEKVGWEETPEGRGMKGGEGWSVGVGV